MTRQAARAEHRRAAEVVRSQRTAGRGASHEEPTMHRACLQRPRARPTATATAAALLALGLAACGGSDNATQQPAATMLEGVVAVGAAVVGADVTISDADGATADVSTKSGASGTYVADVSSLRAPLLVRATGTLNGEAVAVAAVVPALAANAGNVANVTPLTNAVAALIAPAGDIGQLATPAALAGAATATQVGNASALLVNTLKTDPTIAAVLGSSFDPLTTPFIANAVGIDGLLSRLEVSTAGGMVSITNLAAPIGADGAAPAPVQLTPAQVATPTVVPSMPPSTTDPLPTAARMNTLARKLQDCLALPVAQRVTMDSQGTVTAVSAPCNFAPATWRSNGRNWVQEVGQFLFKFDSFTGARAGEPVIAAVFAPNNYTGTTFQHPVCNTATCIVMRIPLTTASGKHVPLDFAVGAVGGVWDFVGNQRPYRVFAEHRMSRKLQVNSALAAANPTSYFANSRIESAIRLIFDPSVGNTAHVRAVRFTGPGLPAAGVVSHRSERCGTDDRFAISNQEGLLTVNNSSAIMVRQPAGGADFIVSAAALDGTAIPMPVPTGWATTASPANQDFAPAPVTAAIPAWSEYTAEIFHFGNNTNVADEVVKMRSGTPYEPATAGPGKPWATLASATIDAYLKPGGAHAGTIDTLAHSLNWAAPADGYVGGAYLFGQNRVLATNAENETANYWKRGRLDFEITALGNTTAGGLEFADPRSSVSMSPSTASSGPNPNPRCTNPFVEPLDGDATRFSYREIGLTVRGADRKLYNAITFWSN
jgi:hypothetical protein